MKLYICWGTFQTPRPGGHPCANAFNALKDAGHDFEVEKLSGQRGVPMLVLDDGEVIVDSKRIEEWAAANPARAAAT